MVDLYGYVIFFAIIMSKNQFVKVQFERAISVENFSSQIHNESGVSMKLMIKYLFINVGVC